jgi:hypothetical protein
LLHYPTGSAVWRWSNKLSTYVNSSMWLALESEFDSRKNPLASWILILNFLFIHRLCQRLCKATFLCSICCWKNCIVLLADTAIHKSAASFLEMTHNYWEYKLENVKNLSCISDNKGSEASHSFLLHDTSYLAFRQLQVDFRQMHCNRWNKPHSKIVSIITKDNLFVTRPKHNVKITRIKSNDYLVGCADSTPSSMLL